ncbi:MAG TPA: glycosyltransferase family 1 protein [Sneathiellales bacterium]|nr:glycosyltransferase family 1 protein [Sneathiellales bacterium]
MLTPIDDPDALANAINYVIDNPAQANAMAAAGFKSFEADYSENVVTGQYMDFLNEVVTACVA